MGLGTVSFFQASRADVAVDFFTVFDERHFLYVRLKGSSRLAVGGADVVAGGLTFSTNTAYS